MNKNHQSLSHSRWSYVQQTLFQEKCDRRLCELGSGFFKIGIHKQ
jgi:hypothetical protein